MLASFAALGLAQALGLSELPGSCATRFTESGRKDIKCKRLQKQITGNSSSRNWTRCYIISDLDDEEGSL